MSLKPEVVTDFRAQPSYGDSTVILSWVLAPGNEDVQTFLCRSPNGLTPWTNVGDPFPGSGWRIDSTPPFEASKLGQMYYRLVLRRGEDTAVTPMLALYSPANKRLFGAMRRFLWEELTQMRLRGGFQILHYVPLTHGTPNPAFDSRSGQVLSSCSDSVGYGLPFVGGYSPPLRTWMRLMDKEKRRVSQEPGAGTVEELTHQARLLAFPLPERGHLLVHPETDDRWVVGEAVAGYKFENRYPMAYTAELVPLRKKGDSRYLVPIPENMRNFVGPNWWD